MSIKLSVSAWDLDILEQALDKYIQDNWSTFDARGKNDLRTLLIDIKALRVKAKVKKTS